MKIRKKTLYSTLIVLALIILIVIIIPKGNPEGFQVFEDKSLFSSIGPDNAPHTVIEFSDFQCPHCTIVSGIPEWTKEYSSASHYAVGKKIKEMATEGKVKFIYVPMSFLGAESVYATQAALCAMKQEKFWEMHDAIFAASTGPEENIGRYSKANLKIIAEGIEEMDIEEFNICLDSDATLADTQKISNIAKGFATSTPTFFVDGRKVSSSWSELSLYLN